LKPVAFDYVRARDAAHAVELLVEATGHARPIAGGQSLGPMLNLRLTRPELLVDVRTCADLRGYSDEGDAIVYGAAITHAEIEDGAVPDACGGWLAYVAQRIAYRAVRNRGTLGGSLAHADPAGDWLPVLLALGAQVIIRARGGLRAMHLAAFVTGPFTTALGAGELLVGIRVRKRSRTARYGYRKLSVKAGEFAKALAVVLHDPAHGEARAVVGAIERTPLVLDDAGALIDDPRAAQSVISKRLPHLSDVQCRLHAVTLARAIQSLGKRESGA
jgi:carbon-monoxide dehydrogenase medium subunit